MVCQQRDEHIAQWANIEYRNRGLQTGRLACKNELTGPRGTNTLSGMFGSTDVTSIHIENGGCSSVLHYVLISLKEDNDLNVRGESHFVFYPKIFKGTNMIWDEEGEYKQVTTRAVLKCHCTNRI